MFWYLATRLIKRRQWRIIKINVRRNGLVLLSRNFLLLEFYVRTKRFKINNTLNSLAAIYDTIIVQLPVAKITLDVYLYTFRGKKCAMYLLVELIHSIYLEHYDADWLYPTGWYLLCVGMILLGTYRAI